MLRNRIEHNPSFPLSITAFFFSVYVKSRSGFYLL
nr:MAG TPA: hypothetical protein [Caudoviricetes sp.]